ncbi:DUF2087 domain-containing protein [Kitasatospora sp. GP82]|uniref:DUF2087 domain-containing protein n=1 Tax=Kitasatospora sp. GP82 TaxID=3035089 RepID=UPI002475C8AC|nr:DUF2087 domain-containing protein [Kitasatospora sp. GP82]MDH6129580.1 hypothetical protein [Kitasatospora sp. GP82]
MTTQDPQDSQNHQDTHNTRDTRNAGGERETPADPHTEAVLRAFVQDGRLTRLPAKRGKRIVVLEHVTAHSFREGATYGEPEVNEILQRWCEGGAADHAALRRELVNERLLDRKDGAYWRSGVVTTQR